MIAGLIGYTAVVALTCGQVNAEEVESLSGPRLLAIEAALPELEKRGLDIAKQRIHVSDDGGTYTVVFVRLGSELTVGGGLSVVLEKRSLRVLRSQIGR